MNALLNPLRSIGRDLVKKRLWPIAVILLAALVAVPLLIRSEPVPAPAAAAAVPAPALGAGSGTPLITVVGPAVTGEDDRPGKLRDPFYDPPEPPAPETSPASGTAPAPAAPTDPGGTPAPVDPPPDSEPADPVVAPAYYRTEIRFYQSVFGKSHPISRLTPLGDLADPAALYMGVSRNKGLFAYFLLGADATSEGEGGCEVEIGCELIGLKEGESQMVTVQPAEGEARQYYIEVVKIERVTTGPGAARRARRHEHPEGRDVLRNMAEAPATAKALKQVSYDSDLGLLVKRAPAVAPSGGADFAKKVSWR